MPVISSLKPSNPPQPTQVAQPTITTTPAAGIQFFCDGCTTPIPGTSARVHCLTCPDYDVCANCALAERFGGTHTAAHPTEVYRMSGTGDSTVQPVRSRAVVTYTMPGAATAAYAAPPAYASPGTSQGGTFAGESVPGGVDDNISGATTGGTTAGGTTSAATGPTDGWGPFFDADLNTSPSYTALMCAIFGHLDSARTGFLPPEAYSRFMDDMGYPIHENIWKNAINGGNLATADTVLKRIFDALGIEHITQARQAPAAQHVFQSLANPPMPLLTPSGLADIIAIELLSDPPAAWPKFARAVQLYGLYNVEPYRRWGPMPRSVVPAVADPRVLAKLAVVDARVLGAANVGAQIQAAANLAAVNAIGGAQYRY
ncbi:hypothetical protein B0H14DRAFT_3042445 [Mycena olivaceomarginata]|nr:hypothetical protein B0H14DRAFT_3042445 [Mycena olivaceomarginata]